MELSQVVNVLGGERMLGKCLENKMDFLELGCEGIPKDALLHLAEKLSLTKKQLAGLVHITERTLQRYSPEDHLNSVITEQVLHIAEVVARGMEVFEEKDKFIAWMNMSNIALADKFPMDLLRSRFGIEMVLDELGRLEHGIYS